MVDGIDHCIYKYILYFFGYFSDLRSLIQQLENSKYSTIIYVLANGTSSITNSQQEENANIVRDYVKGRVPKIFSYDFSGYCDVVSKEFGLLYNKNIIFWPCPKMKVSNLISWFTLTQNGNFFTSTCSCYCYDTNWIFNLSDKYQSKMQKHNCLCWWKIVEIIKFTPVLC